MILQRRHTWLTFTTVLLGATPAIAESGPANPAAASSEASRAQTVKNLEAAIRGEANAAYRYRLFARQADMEGHTRVADLFIAAAESESVHRRNHEEALRVLGRAAPIVQLGDVEVRSTRENLQVPLKGERDEASEMYPRFIEQARQAGAEDAVRSFQQAEASETEHERLFQQAFDEMGQRPGARVFYVSTKSGETLARRPSEPAPSATSPGERYIEVGPGGGAMRGARAP